MKKILKFNNIKGDTVPLISLGFVAFFYTILSIGARFMSVGFESLTQVYVRLLIGSLLATLIFRKDLDFTKIKRVKRNDWVWLVVMGVFGYGLSVYYLTIAVLNTKIINVTVISATIPFFVYLLSAIFLKDKLNWKKTLFVILSIYGVSVLSFKSFIPNMNNLGLGEIYAVTGVFFWSFWSIGRKKLSNFLNNSEITVIVMFIAGFSTFLFALLVKENFNIMAFTIPVVLIGLLIGVFLNILVTLLENYAFGKVKNLVLANQVLSLDNIFALLIGYMFYSEVITFYETIGAILIFLSIYSSSKVK